MNRKRDKKDAQRADEPSDDDSISSDEEMDDESSWISWFCSLKGNEFFCEVDEEYIRDDFNLTGLRAHVPNYEYALDLILDDDSDEYLSPEQQEIVESAAEFLYGLIHARYILTSRGMHDMVKKYEDVSFGRCPRVMCQGQPVLPCGQTDVPRLNTVKIVCPQCKELYYPRLHKHSNIDGAYFGTTFPHLLLLTYPDLAPSSPVSKYVPKIYGFGIHPSSGQRQKEVQESHERLQEKVKSLQQMRAKKAEGGQANAASQSTVAGAGDSKKRARR